MMIDEYIRLKRRIHVHVHVNVHCPTISNFFIVSSPCPMNVHYMSIGYNLRDTPKIVPCPMDVHSIYDSCVSIVCCVLCIDLVCLTNTN